MPPEFARLRAQLETEWVPGLRDLLDLPGDDPRDLGRRLPLGPPADDGTDTYVLCEINCSCVTPFPPEAPEHIAPRHTRQPHQTRRTEND